MRYVIKFSKESEIKFISHLDLMRTIQRIVRRANLPAEYSKGFNPHMNLSLAQPLPVGIYSKGEYLDLVLTEEMEEEEIKCRLNENAPSGIRFSGVIKVPAAAEGEKKVGQIMALLDAAAYRVKIQYDNTSSLEGELDLLLKSQAWNTVKKSKSGEKEVDIKPLIKEFKYSIAGNTMVIEALLACGSRENLSPELFSEYIGANTSGVKKDSFVEIMREEMYTVEGKDFVSINSYLI
ncbi:MAG: TIGR03936 family radical SAM-associated protein [Bacillota bacterium]|nr:TIGR03936 family radical SAM-associated protein [Bacillota bacterium]